MPVTPSTNRIRPMTGSASASGKKKAAQSSLLSFFGTPGKKQTALPASPSPTKKQPLQSISHSKSNSTGNATPASGNKKRNIDVSPNGNQENHEIPTGSDSKMSKSNDITDNDVSLPPTSEGTQVSSQEFDISPDRRVCISVRDTQS